MADNTVSLLGASLTNGLKGQFEKRRTVLSFQEYLDLVAKTPNTHLRSAAQYFANVIEHFSSETLKLPTGDARRYLLFDAPFDQGEGQVMGHERVQANIVRHINNFVRQGRADRLILLHGPNGSAKSSLVRALARAAEVYSESDAGALYRFNWVFPLKKATQGAMGFAHDKIQDSNSYAHIPNDDIEARIPCELKDHPLLLLPREYRDTLLRNLHETRALSPDFPTPNFIRTGDLSSKNKKIFDALLVSYQGDIQQVLRHIQVERFYLSQRFRVGIAVVEPQMSVDAFGRQVTMDQSLSRLPAALQHLSLVETGGALSDGNRGLIEYNDLLKRPLDSWKYLLVATEQQQASLDLASLFFDSLMIGSSNELHLQGFREYPDWQSFKGRFELVKVPYLLRYSDEVRIYENQVPKALVGAHIAPHALEIAARWAVLTRLEPPRPDAYPEAMRDLVLGLTPSEKLELYDQGLVPERLSQKDAKEIRHHAETIYGEYDDEMEYEGRQGASPREIRTLLFNAAQDKRFDHLSPLAVLDALRALVRERSSYEFLRREPMRGYRDPIHFIDIVETHYRRQLDEEVRMAMGLITANSHHQAFERYVRHISAWTKHEKVPDPHTGKMVDADQDLMRQIEKILLAFGESPEEFRRSLIVQIGAYRLENPDRPVDYAVLFASYLRRLKDDYFGQQKKVVDRMQTHFLHYIEGDVGELDDKEKEQVASFHRNLQTLGYNNSSAKQAIVYLLKPT